MRVFEMAGQWLNMRADAYRRTVVVLTLLVGLVPALLAASWVAQYGVDIPTKDDWDMAPIIVKAQKGQLVWADLYEQLAEARMVVPKLIFIASAAGGHWDPRDQMMLAVVVCALTAAGIYWLLRRTGIAALPGALAFWLIALLIFSPAQFEVWVWAAGLPSFMPALFLVAALCLIATRFSTAVKFIGCALLAVAASFTLAHGLLLWGLTFPVLLLDRAAAHRVRWFFAWMLVTALFAWWYFYGYIKPPHHPEFAPSVSALDYVRYLAAFLGGELAYAAREHTARANVAIATGGVLFALYSAAALYVAARWRDAELVRRVAPWFALGAYAIGCGVLAALGRIGFGLDSALSSRYVTFSLYLSVAVVALAAVIVSELRQRPERVRVAAGLRVVAALLCCGYLALYALCFSPCVRRMHWTWANTRLARSAVILSDVLDTSEVIKRTTYPDPAFVRKAAGALDELKLLRPSLVRSADAAQLLSGAVDDRTAAGWCDAVVPSGGGEYRATGWATLPASGRPADAVLLAYRVPGDAWVPFALSDAMVKRRDIARLFKDQHQLWSGWATVFPRAAVPENAVVGAWAVDIEQPKLYRLNQATPEFKL